jgi:RNA polymerase sigma-70 factor (sigma-B/F/G subfamily)
MDEVCINVRRVDDARVVRFEGVLDLAAALRLRLVLYDGVDAGCRDIVVDLSEVRLVDCSAVGVLMRVRYHLAERGGRLRVAGATGLVLKMLEVCQAAEPLRAYDGLDAMLPAGSPHAPIEATVRDPARRSDPWGFEVTQLLHEMAALPAGDRRRAELRRRAIESCLPHAERLARRFHGLGESPSDLSQVAVVGLLRAVDGYDPAVGTDFGAYARPTILGELRRYFRDHGWGVHVPRRLQELRLEVNRARAELAQELGRSPSAADVARRLDVSVDLVGQAAVAAGAYRPSSLFAPMGGDDGPTPYDRLGEPDAGLDTVDLRESIQPLLRKLPDRDMRIISMRFYGNMTQAEIAAELGISQMHVSRLLKRIVHRLRRALLGDR